MIPTLAQSHGITNREAFQSAVEHINAIVLRGTAAPDEALSLKVKADALRAWASFDKRLSVDEKKEANRAATRVAKMLVAVAEQEQPYMPARGGRLGSLPGPIAWLKKNCNITHATAANMRKFCKNDELYRATLSEGLYWSSAFARASASNSTAGFTAVGKFNSATRKLNTIATALTLSSPGRVVARKAIRTAVAWLQAYDNAIVSLQNRIEDQS